MKRSAQTRQRRSVQTTRLAIDLPVETHRKLKAQAAERGMSMRDLVLVLLRQAGLS